MCIDSGSRGGNDRMRSNHRLHAIEMLSIQSPHSPLLGEPWASEAERSARAPGVIPGLPFRCCPRPRGDASSGMGVSSPRVLPRRGRLWLTARERGDTLPPMVRPTSLLRSMEG